MLRTGILELIWQGAVKPADGVGAARLRRLLRAMLPMRIVCLTAATGIDRVLVLPDELEVMPALPLGDVVAEELPLDVPYGALLMICDEDAITPPLSDAELSFDVGLAVGHTLLTVLRRGVFPLERENEALYVMACAFDRLARSPGLERMGLVAEEFSAGLADPLGAYWSGTRDIRSVQNGLFHSRGCLASADLRSYLTTLDPGFSAPEHGRVPPELLAFGGNTVGFADWLEGVERSVVGVLERGRKRLIDG